MNRRSLLGLLGFAPMAAPVVVRAALAQSSPGTALTAGQIASINAAKLSGKITASQIGSISADRFVAGSIGAGQIDARNFHPSFFETSVSSLPSDQAHLLGALSFGA